MQLYNLKVLDGPAQNLFGIEKYTYILLIRKYFRKKKESTSKERYKRNTLGIFNSFIQIPTLDLYPALRMQRCLGQYDCPQGAHGSSKEEIIKQLSHDSLGVLTEIHPKHCRSQR